MRQPDPTRSDVPRRSHPDRAPVPLAGTPEAPLLTAADRLTRRVAEATSQLATAYCKYTEDGDRPATQQTHADSPSEQMTGEKSGLGYALRESAVLAQAGAAAACRQPRARDRRQGLAATDRCLDRLATWLGLAERFGDLAPPTVLALLEELSRVRVELLALAGSSGPEAAETTHATITLDVNNVSRYHSP